MIYYSYYNRGKCVSCNQVIWNTSPLNSVQCQCNSAFLSYSTSTNITNVEDDEFILSIQEELNTQENIVLTQITE